MKNFGKYIAVILCIIAVIAIVMSTENNSVENINVTLPQSNENKFIPREVPDGFKEYRNTKYKFSLLYPQELEVKEFFEGEGATTITFQNVVKGIGFQIFVLPYLEKEVTDERFLKDVPSGVRASLADATVDGAVGATFYSWNSALMAETYEVWFIHNKYLYEVTTLKYFNTSLDEILKTWNFIN